MTKIRPQHGYSLANLTKESRDVDSFGVEGFSELYGDRMEIIVPEPSKSDREQYDLPRRGDWDGSRGADEYRDSFVPMMNSLWPVELAYGRGEQETADLINRHAGATTLIRIDDDYYIGMTGGGMDLSWHIAAAYVCCGCVPPLYILESLKGSPFRVGEAINRAVLSAARRGVKHLSDKAKRLRADLRRAAKGECW